MLIDVLNDKVKAAMRVRDTFTANKLRMIIASAKGMAKSAVRDVSDDDVVKSCQRLSKDANIVLEAAERLGREDVISDCKKELAIYSEYIPKMMGEDEVKAAISEIIKNENPSNFGALMKSAMPKLKGRADGKMVASVCKEFFK